MREATLAAVDAAVRAFREGVAKAVLAASVRAYMKGDARAFRFMRVEPPPMALRAAAERFTSGYTQDLLVRGGSTVWDPEQGKAVFKPWLADSSEETRSRIVDIIEKGLEDGKYPGVKERKKGGYTEGTIAADLEDYFDERRSHASTVARTEAKRIQNRGMLDRYAERGYAEVTVLDDEGPNSCDACEAANGQVWTVEEAAERMLEHPNCVRDFAPIVEDFPLKVSEWRKEERGVGCRAGSR